MRDAQGRRRARLLSQFGDADESIRSYRKARLRLNIVDSREWPSYLDRYLRTSRTKLGGGAEPQGERLMQVRIGRSLIGGVALASLLITSCGSSGDDSGGSSGGANKVRVTTLALCTEAPLWGDHEGMFDDAGVSMDLVSSGGGSASLDAVESGAADIAFVNPLTLIKANQAGRDLVIVGGAQISTPDTNAVIVKAGTGFDRPASLEGATIGINEIGGLGHEMTKAWIAGDGGDPEKAEFVALGFPELVPAVEGGQIDASQVTASQGAQAEQSSDLDVIGNPFYEVDGTVPTSVYAAKRSWVEANPETVEAWQKTLMDASLALEDEEQRERQIEVMSEKCKTDPEVLAATPRSPQTGDMDMDSLERLITILEDVGAIEAGVNAAELVPEFVRS